MALKLRIAFDIGSGATKVCGAIIRQSALSPSTVEEILFEREQPLLVGQAVKNESVDGKTIPQSTIEEMRRCLAEMLQQVHHKFGEYQRKSNCHEAVPEQRAGIATAIFRVASNGPEVLSLLSKEFCIRCQILSQDEEATLGYETAQQMFNSSAPAELLDSKAVQLVSYDSGGASFQLCTREGQILRYFNGQWGSTIAHLALLKLVKNVKDKYDPNPVGPDAALAFHQLLMADLGNSAKHPAAEREFFQDLTKNIPQIKPFCEGKGTRSNKALYLLGIGGHTSAFNMCSKVFGGASYIEREALWTQILTVYCLKTNEELIAMSFVQPEVLVAKLILVYTVLTHLGGQGFHFQQVVGNTRAVLGKERFWSDNSKM